MATEPVTFTKWVLWYANDDKFHHTLSPVDKLDSWSITACNCS